MSLAANYDNYLLLAAYLHLDLVPKILCRSTSILLIELENGSRFIDSLQVLMVSHWLGALR